MILELVDLVGTRVGSDEPEIVKPLVPRDVGPDGKLALPANDAQLQVGVVEHDGDAARFNLKAEIRFY